MASCRRDARLQPADVTLFLHHLRQFGVAAEVCNRDRPAPNSAERSWRHFHRHGRSPMPPLEFRRVRRVFETHHYCGAGASRRLDAPYKYFHGSVQIEVALRGYPERKGLFSGCHGHGFAWPCFDRSEATATQSRDRGTQLNTCVTVRGTLIRG